MLLLGALNASAQFLSVRIDRHDGSSLYIGMRNTLTVNVSDENLIFSSLKRELSIPKAEISRWIFSNQEGDDNVWSGIDAPKAAVPTILYDNDRILVKGLTAGSPINLYGIDGSPAHSATVGDDGVCVLSTDAFSKGIYILHYQNHSLKIYLNR